MVNINILHKGDTVLTVTEQILAVKRRDGTVDIYSVCTTPEGEFCIDPVKSAVIGYGAGMVGKTADDGETTVYAF